MYKVESLAAAKKRLNDTINDKIKYCDDIVINWNNNHTMVFVKIYVFGMLHKTICGYIRNESNLVVISEKYAN